jgi:4-amino-4-deoxy-L-arabinose transferase-like glycosyltransferase
VAVLPPGSVPKALLALLLVLWVGCGLWIVRNAPFGSGTDESIEYVAFAAAENRWATEEDRRGHGIDHFYYPPLYFLAFAPFWGREPSFVEGYPGGHSADRNYASLAGRRTVSTDYLSRVPPPVDRLYRQAKLFSLGLGLACLLALAATLRLLFPGPSGWWAALLGSAPLVFLPQFLFYQTLVNNDALLNALGALASLAFAAAVFSLERGRERRFLALSLAAGACIGLAFLTKMSAPVLLPLALGLAWARIEADRHLPLRARLGRALLLLALLAAAIHLAGGWWVGYRAWQGDWNSFKAHRIAHPWAVADPAALASPAWWAKQVVQIIRSFYALFSGALYIGVPDLVILAWLTLPLAALAAAAVTARSGGPNRPNGDADAARRVVLVTFAGVVLCNLGAVVANLRFFEAAYGRLLFPSLVAVHSLAATAVAGLARGRPRALAAAALTVTAGSGALFGWTFIHRLGPAVAQPPEDVRVLNDAGATGTIEPIWAFSVEQPLILPPGNLAALRVDVKRSNFVPQVGAALEGTLEVRAADGRRELIPLRRTALGDSDYAVYWTEIELVRPARLGASTPALLTLRATPPAWPRGLTSFGYRCGGRWFPAKMNGATAPCALFVAAVYRP